MLALPLSARFAVWFSSWLDATSSLDDARDAIVGRDTSHHVSGLPSAPGSHALIVALGLLRGVGARGAGVALPAPGDLFGLAGPAAFNAEVVEAGEGVVLEGVDLGLVPHRVGAGVQWVAHPAVSLRQMPDPTESESTLRRALSRTADLLSDLDVARWRPEVADELMAVRGDADLGLPGSTTQRAVRLATLAARCRAVVELALADDGGAISAAEAAARRAALVPLDQAARHALVAACSPRVWPPSAA